MMKKGILLLIMVMIVGSFAACGKKENNDKDNQKPGVENNDQDKDKPDGEEGKNDKDQGTPAEGDDGQTEGNGEQGADVDLSELIAKIYEIKEAGLMVGDIEIDLADGDSVKYYTGLADASKLKSAMASESMISSQAYSLVLVQLKDKADAEAVGKGIAEGVDQRKWICVEGDDMQVVAHEDIVMLIMVSSAVSDTVTAQELVDAFAEVRGTDSKSLQSFTR